MRRIVLAAVLITCCSTPLLAADKTKQDLVGELLDVLDTRAMTEELVHTYVTYEPMGEEYSAYLQRLSDEERARHELAMEQQRAAQAKLKEQLLQRIDYDRIALEIYAPLYEREFTAEELEELIAFYKTKVGRKQVAILPRLAFSAQMRVAEVMQDEMRAIQEEIAREERAREPKWKQTLADLRTLATATEAWSTDYNRYPDARNITELAEEIEPTYIRTTPLKDAWGNEFAYIVSSDHQQYRFVSAGEDGKFEWDSRKIETLPEGFSGTATDDPAADIIYQNGMLVRFPREAAQR
jgi:hypothetical protein